MTTPPRNLRFVAPVVDDPIPVDVPRAVALIRADVRPEPRGLLSGLTLAMRQMAMVNAEAEAAHLTREDRRALFEVCVPTPVLATVSETVFEAHARELAERIRRGADVRPATSAEMLGAVLIGAAKAPPSLETLALFERLYEDVTGREVTDLPGYPDRPVWREQATSAREALRFRMGAQDRGPNPPAPRNTRREGGAKPS